MNRFGATVFCAIFPSLPLSKGRRRAAASCSGGARVFARFAAVGPRRVAPLCPH